MGLSCFRCLASLSLEEGQRISRREECPHCSVGLRVCKMCQFYDPSLYNECREESAERVVEKENPNFCDFFRLGPRRAVDEERGEALKRAENLFKS